MNRPPSIRTENLLLRAPDAADQEALFEIQGDQDAMQYTYCAPSFEASVAHLDAYSKRFDEDGYAPWVALLGDESRVVGWGGLCCDPEVPDWGPEVVYFIHRDYWGRGFASEIATAALRLAFEEVGLEKVGAFSRPANKGSRTVLERAGYKFVKYAEAIERNQYAITREDWRATHSV